MSDKKRSNRYAAETIDEEGLDYAVRHYISGDAFEDENTARLWNEAAKANQALVDYLYEQGNDIQ